MLRSGAENLFKAAFTLSGKSELYRHKPASNIFDAVRYRRFVAIKLTFAAKCKRGLIQSLTRAGLECVDCVTMQYIILQYSTVHGTIHVTVQYTTVQSSKVKYMVQYMVQYSRVQFSTVQ